MSGGGRQNPDCEHERILIREFGTSETGVAYSHADDEGFSITVRDDALVECLDCGSTLTGKELTMRAQ